MRAGVRDLFEITADLSRDGGCEPLQHRPLKNDHRDDLDRHVEESSLATILDAGFHCK